MRTSQFRTNSDFQTEFQTQPPWFVGILNLTPDSFSDGGLYLESGEAEKRADYLVACGAHVVDIGGESTRPGSQPITEAEELSRIEPTVARIANKHFLSIDTYKAKVAARCLELGARMINDVSALRADSAMASVIRDANAYVIMMHSKETDDRPHASDRPRKFTNVVTEIADFLKRRVDYALSQGISLNRIVLDPGMGRFISNDPEDSWRLLENFQALVESLPCPVLIGTSRKGFLGGSLEDRDPASQLTALIAQIKGASFIRTHDVRMAREFVRIWQRTVRP